MVVKYGRRKLGGRKACIREGKILRKIIELTREPNEKLIIIKENKCTK